MKIYWNIFLQTVKKKNFNLAQLFPRILSILYIAQHVVFSLNFPGRFSVEKTFTEKLFCIHEYLFNHGFVSQRKYFRTKKFWPLKLFCWHIFQQFSAYLTQDIPPSLIICTHQQKSDKFSHISYAGRARKRINNNFQDTHCRARRKIASN